MRPAPAQAPATRVQFGTEIVMLMWTPNLWTSDFHGNAQLPPYSIGYGILDLRIEAGRN